MDYGQTKQTVNPENEQPFFTAGAGNESTDINTFESENNFDLTNAQSSWGNAKGANLRGIGNNTINSITREQTATSESSNERSRIKEFIPNPNSNPFNEPLPDAPKLGEVVSTMPPGYVETNAQNLSNKPTTSILFTSDTMMEGNKLSGQALSILQEEEKKLSSDGDIAGFVDKIAEYREQFQGRQTA